MSDSCHISPLQQLGNKSNKFQSGFPGTLNFQQQSYQGSTHAHDQHENSKENIFLQQNHPNLFQQQQQQQQPQPQPQQYGFMGQRPLSPLSPGSTIAYQGQRPSLSSTASSSNDLSEAWLNQFSSMQVNDPLEFNKEYKNLYESYMNGGGSATATTTRPMLSRNHQSSTAFLPSYQRQQSNFTGMMSSNGPLSAPQLDQTQQQQQGSIDSYFDLEFNQVERELSQVERDISQPVPVGPNWNKEQVEFQKIATDIVRVCTPDEPVLHNAPMNRTGGLKTKLATSKFMGLMKRVSEGSVSIRNTERELFTPETGEVEGNEYFPVLDQKQETL